MYKPSELGSTLTEICNPKNFFIIGCTYKHKNMDINEFNDDYLNYFLDNFFSCW